MRSDRERLLDILDAADRIEGQVDRGRLAFAGDDIAQTVDLVWSVAENDLPRLGAQIRAIVDQLP